jgi:hypothetical protein
MACTVDEVAIRNHFKSTSIWNFVPYIGPAIAGKVATPLPDDQGDALGKATSNFDASVDEWQKQITSVVSGNTQNISALSNLLRPYVESRLELKTLPLSHQENIIWVQIVSIAIILGFLIIFGRY